MLTIHDINDLNQVTNLLAGGLANGPHTVTNIPLEVAQALSEARDQMNNLPEVIANLATAFDRFNTVSTALTRMIALADAALNPDLEEQERLRLNEEFANLAKIVAADAGRQYYTGPRLNLLNQGEAESAAKIIRYLNPVIDTMGQELIEQKNLIHEVVSETINFLGIVAQCYPDSEGASRLGHLINQARQYVKSEQISTPAGMLH